jgi:hypothetical protein
MSAGGNQSDDLKGRDNLPGCLSSGEKQSADLEGREIIYLAVCSRKAVS